MQKNLKEVPVLVDNIHLLIYVEIIVGFNAHQQTTIITIRIKSTFYFSVLYSRYTIKGINIILPFLLLCEANLQIRDVLKYLRY